MLGLALRMHLRTSQQRRILPPHGRNVSCPLFSNRSCSKQMLVKYLGSPFSQRGANNVLMVTNSPRLCISRTEKDSQDMASKMHTDKLYYEKNDTHESHDTRQQPNIHVEIVVIHSPRYRCSLLLSQALHSLSATEVMYQWYLSKNR